MKLDSRNFYRARLATQLINIYGSMVLDFYYVMHATHSSVAERPFGMMLV